MNVKELIKELSKFPPENEIWFSDGYNAAFYESECSIIQSDFYENGVEILLTRIEDEEEYLDN